MGPTGRGPAVRVLPDEVWDEVESLNVPGPAAVEHANRLLAALGLPPIGLRWYQRQVALRQEQRGSGKRRMADDGDDFGAAHAAKLPRAPDATPTCGGLGGDATAQPCIDDSCHAEPDQSPSSHYSPREDAGLDDAHLSSHSPSHSPSRGDARAGYLAPDATVSNKVSPPHAGTLTHPRCAPAPRHRHRFLGTRMDLALASASAGPSAVAEELLSSVASQSSISTAATFETAADVQRQSECSRTSASDAARQQNCASAPSSGPLAAQDVEAELAACLIRLGLTAGSDALRKALGNIGEAEWTCRDCSKSLRNRCFSEEIHECGRSEVFCTKCYAKSSQPADVVVTVHYAASDTRAAAHAVAMGLPPKREEDASRKRLREELAEMCEQYLAIAKAFDGKTSFNGGRYGIFISHVRGKRHKDWLPQWLSGGKARSAKKNRRLVREKAIAIGSSLFKMGELYDAISAKVLDVLAAERSALEELMRRLRPNAIAGWRTLTPRALELILADAGVQAQDTHKDLVLPGQLQAQMYVTGASSATVLQRFDGDAIGQQRQRYAELHGAAPGTGWEGKANVMGELAAICAADEGDLCTWPVTKGDVPAGQWQAIGELGATHHGPASDVVRVILVTVLTYGDDFDISPLQEHLVPAALHLGDARALVTRKAVKQLATTYMQQRSVSDVQAYDAYIAAGASGPPPDMPDMYSFLCDVLKPHARQYAVHEWSELYRAAFCAFVEWHSQEACGAPQTDLQGAAERAEAGKAGLVEHCTSARDTRGWRTWEPVHDGSTTARAEPDAPMSDASSDGSDGDDASADEAFVPVPQSGGIDGPAVAGAAEQETVASESDEDDVAEETGDEGGRGDGAAEVCTGVWAPVYKPDPSGVWSTDKGATLRYYWDETEQLQPRMHAEQFVVERGRLEIRPEGLPSVFVFTAGQCGVIHAGFKGFLLCSNDLRKKYAFLDPYGRQVEQGNVCDGCKMPLGGAYYAHTVRLPEELQKCTGQELERIAEALGIQPENRRRQKHTLVNLLRTAKKRFAVRFAGARAAAKPAAKKMGGSSNSSTGKGKQGKAGKAKKTASKGKKPAGKSGASVGAQVRRKPRAGNVKASVEDLVGLCKEVGLDLGVQAVTNTMWQSLIERADPDKTRRPRAIEGTLCCECYLRKAPADAKRMRFGKDFPLSDEERARARVFQTFAQAQREKVDRALN